MNILNQLTIKHLKMNPKRTIVTIIGVALSAALMVGIGLLFSSMRENSIQRAIASGGSYHAMIEDVNSKQMKQIEKNPQIKLAQFSQYEGYGKIDDPENLYQPYYYIQGLSDQYLKQLEVIEGRLPQNDREIVISKQNQSSDTKFQLGQEVQLSIGDRYIQPDDEKIKLLHNESYEQNEIFEETETRTYRVVGYVNPYVMEHRDGAGYFVYTKLNLSSKGDIRAIITYQSISGVYEKTETLAKSIGVPSKTDEDGNLSFETVHYNDYLLSLYGQSNYHNAMDGIYGIIMIMLGLVSIACIIVIYNSFAISVMERKKQFGLFTSIGATKKQLHHTVFFESFIIGIIGIPLGILFGYIGIGSVIQVINILLPKVFDAPLTLSTYPPLVMIPIIFMIVVIFVSAYLPARRAGKITPIEAIRQNDDIKIKGKKLKTSKWISYVFGVEGELALKNMKRNKKKYRITIVSLFISIVLFISFSSLLEYGITGTDSYFNNVNFDISLYINDSNTKKIDEFVKSLKTEKEVKKIGTYRASTYETAIMKKSQYDSKLYQLFEKKLEPSSQGNDVGMVRVIAFDDQTYHDYQKQIGAKGNHPILINVTNKIYYDQGKNRKTYHGPIYRQDQISSISLWKLKEGVEDQIDWNDQNVSRYFDKNQYQFEDIVFADIVPFGILEDETLDSPIIVVSNQMYDEIENIMDSEEQMDQSYQIAIQAPTYDVLDQKFTEIENQHTFNHFFYNNITEEMIIQRNITIVIKILLFGFIGLVTCIGITSVFNTIHTNMTLRRKEFAMLRSIGLTPKGLNRVIYFESLFFGLKSLCYGYIASLGVVYLIHTRVSSIVNLGGILIPYRAMFLSAVGVFMIVLISMLYASKKMRHENILDAIREENI